MIKNGRKHIRYKLFPYTYDVLINTPKGVLRAGLHDVAEGGAGLFLDDSLSVGQHIELIVTIKNQALHFSGTVRWISSLEDTYSFQTGIQFSAIDHSKALKLIENLSSNKSY